MNTNDISHRRCWLAIACVAALGALASGCVTADPKLEAYETAEKIAAERLAKFDTLDFNVYTNQKWDRLQESHAKDIKVHWPDGRTTTGIESTSRT